jgi:Cytosine deaminase and related metal-dependent hydrolases
MKQSEFCDLLLSADIVVTQDSERRVLRDAALAISDGKILAIGPQEDLRAFNASRKLHLGNTLVMPGLVNGHTHVSMTFLRGLADDLPLMEWLNGHIFPREKHLTAEIVEMGALLGCAEMTRTGTTAFADMYLIEDAVAAAVDASGLRARLGEGIFMFPSPAFANTEEAFALVRSQHARYAGHPRIRIGVMPHSVYTTTPDILRTCRELADELHLPLHIHLAETESETAACLEKYGKRPVTYCAELGIFGPDCSIAHGVILTDEELEFLAQTGSHIVHNPKSNMKLASGVAPVPGMLARGMLPGLGTDGAASNNSLNLFEEMSVCSLLHKAKSKDPTVCPAGTVLDMATLGSAAALSWPELGRLVPGAPADIIALDLSSPNLQPLYEPVSHLVYAASGHEVCFSMVAGEVLFHNGAFTRLDYQSLLGEAEKLKQWVLRHK